MAANGITENYQKKFRKESGLQTMDVSHCRPPAERPFTAAERKKVTLLFGGLTSTHEKLLKGVFESLGYRADFLPIPDNESLAVGKEYCNRGQCNPTYYIVGNLIKHLKKMREAGEKDIEERFLFVTVGACGPCRFGMYEAEYRKALDEAGFGRFRVIIVNQSGNIGSGMKEEGLKTDWEFYFSLIRGIMVGDLINELKYRIRPYEINKGDADRAAGEALEIVYAALKGKRMLFKPLREVRGAFERVKADFTRIKPKVKLIGEFWAQTTEGDGNYRLPQWLEEEGCEVSVQPVSSWIDYTIWWWKQYLRDRIPVQRRIAGKGRYLKGLVKINLLSLLFKFYYNFYRLALGFVSAPLPSQRKLAEMGGEYYNTRIGGGEGHLEVAKNLQAIIEKKAHLVISVKPFGCMPSTQSDGIQAKIMSDYKRGLFVPVETSGDGEINVKSRVQMKLHEAKLRAKEEVAMILDETGLDAEQFRDLAMRMENTLAVLKINAGYTTTAGNFALLLSKKR